MLHLQSDGREDVQGRFTKIVPLLHKIGPDEIAAPLPGRNNCKLPVLEVTNGIPFPTATTAATAATGSSSAKRNSKHRSDSAAAGAGYNAVVDAGSGSDWPNDVDEQHSVGNSSSVISFVC
jgi:hypothetical protein